MRGKPAGSQFKFYSGVPCLDYLVTLRGRKDEKLETLESFSDFIDWCRLAGLVADHEVARLKAIPPRKTARVLRDAITLRESLYRIFSAVAANRPIPATDLPWVNRLLRHETCYWQIRLDTDARPVKEKIVVPAGPLEPLLRVGQSAVELLTSDEIDFLRACSNPRCSVFFIDQSRNHSRRWCSMARCGNLIKVTRFYARRRAARTAQAAAEAQVGAI